jgi:hypothetical protein
MWRVWRPEFGWNNLCPIKWADPMGFVVVMRRASQPVTFEEIVEADRDYHPDITSETKPEDFGRVDGHVVVLDYGLWDASDVEERRDYYKGFRS